MTIPAVDVSIPRQVFASRRVTLPTKTARRVLGRDAPAQSLPRVEWSVPNPTTRTALVTVARDGADAARVRQVTKVWQVPIPVPVMTDLDLDVLDWVYIGVAADQSGLTVTPARAARLVGLAPGPGKGVGRSS